MGVREGDLILEVNRATIRGLDDLKRVMRRGALYRMRIQRGDELIVLSRR